MCKLAQNYTALGDKRSALRVFAQPHFNADSSQTAEIFRDKSKDSVRIGVCPHPTRTCFISFSKADNPAS